MCPLILILMNTQHTIINIKKKIAIKYPKFAAIGFFSRGLKNEFEIALVYEPSVFEPLTVYCMLVLISMSPENIVSGSSLFPTFFLSVLHII